MSEKQIITFSRRTDPAFHMPWLLDKINRGGCLVPNPFNKKPYWVGLKPDEVLLLNFWTKAPSVVQPYLKDLSDYRVAFFITHTNYPKWVEPNVPDLAATADAVDKLAKLLSSDGVWFRYDPIILTNAITPAWHVQNFKMLCEKVWGGRTKRGIISLIHDRGPYAWIRPLVESAARNHDDAYRPAEHDQFMQLASKLTVIAQGHGIDLRVCCSPIVTPEDASRCGLRQGECLSEDSLKALGIMPPRKKKPTRKGSLTHDYAPCGCLASRDIGAKRTCGHFCCYCYAEGGDVGQCPAIPACSPWLCSDPLPAGYGYPAQARG